MGKIVDPALRANYAIGEWMIDYQEGNELHFVVSDTTGADDDAVVQGIINWLIDNDDYWPPDGEEAFYAEDQTYIPLEPAAWRHSSLWSRFRDEIMHRQRFFNGDAQGLLRDIFDGVQFQSDIRSKPAFYRLNPKDGRKLYRARVIRTDRDYEQIKQNPATGMGAPPAGLRRAGRMNAAGIAVFYGATDLDTAIAELRPAVGSTVCVCTFELRRPIYVLDLTRFTKPGKKIDILARNQVRRSTQWAFMQSFANEISKPILPGDEHLEYVPAQVVAEFLTTHPMKWGAGQVTSDAIIFNSAQSSGGRNIAIMGDAAGAIVVGADAPATSDHDALDGEFDLMEFATSARPPPNPGLEVRTGSLTRFTIESAAFGRGEPFPAAQDPGDHF